MCYSKPSIWFFFLSLSWNFYLLTWKKHFTASLGYILLPASVLLGPSVSGGHYKVKQGWHGHKPCSTAAMDLITRWLSDNVRQCIQCGDAGQRDDSGRGWDGMSPRDFIILLRHATKIITNCLLNCFWSFVCNISNYSWAWVTETSESTSADKR